MKKRKKHISASNHCRLGFFSFLAIRLQYLLLCVAAIVVAEHGSLSCVHVVYVSSYSVDLSIVGQISETANYCQGYGATIFIIKNILRQNLPRKVYSGYVNPFSPYCCTLKQYCILLPTELVSSLCLFSSLVLLKLQGSKLTF